MFPAILWGRMGFLSYLKSKWYKTFKLKYKIMYSKKHQKMKNHSKNLESFYNTYSVISFISKVPQLKTAKNVNCSIKHEENAICET